MMHGPWSLRRRLMAALGLITLLAWCASSLWLYRAALQEADLLFDNALDHTAHAVLAVVRNEAAELSESNGGIGFELATIDRDGHHNEIFYQVRGPNGGIAFRSHGAPVVPLAGAHDRGYGTVKIEGQKLRVFTLTTDDNIATIHVAQPMSQRTALAREGAVRLLAPGPALMLLLVLAVAWAVRRTIEPVVRYAGALEQFAPESESSVDGSRLPQELQPVTRAIDGLLARVHEALLHERTLTADAAHELRTPLAALRLQAQVALRAQGAGEREAALTELLAATDRAARVVDSVLTLARYDARSSAGIGNACVYLGRLAHLVQGEFEPIAAARGIAIEVRADETNALGDEDALAIAIRNLVGNALRYARARVRVEISSENGRAEIVVRDDGPGISAELAQRVFQRFFRGPDVDGSSPGAGLGLALVRRILELHGGSVQLVPGIDGGAGVRLSLPRARATA
jgi:signal transduction histidine kinase